MGKQEDIELIQKILNGNTQAQEILYNKYNKEVKNFLKKKYSLYYDIDDDVSEIMIKVFLGLKTYDPIKSKFKSWAFSIAKNYMIDKWRNKNYTNTSFEFKTNSSGSNYYFVNNMETISANTSSFTVSDNTADIEFENCNSVAYISSQLTPQDFTWLDMKYVQGYNYDEIGNEFNVSSSTISNRVNYIKTKLKKNNLEMNFN